MDLEYAGWLGPRMVFLKTIKAGQEFPEIERCEYKGEKNNVPFWANRKNQLRANAGNLAGKQEIAVRSYLY